jgi:hypothetical protein
VIWVATSDSVNWKLKCLDNFLVVLKYRACCQRPSWSINTQCVMAKCHLPLDKFPIKWMHLNICAPYTTYTLTTRVAPTCLGMVTNTNNSKQQCCHLTGSGFDSLALRNSSGDWLCVVQHFGVECFKEHLETETETESCEWENVECIPSVAVTALWWTVLMCASAWVRT